MAAPVTFPDVALLVIDYLRAVLAPTPVEARVPRVRPATFVQVRPVGGARIWPVQDQVRLAVSCWAAGDKPAQDLCQAARSAVHALAGTTTLGPVCYRVEDFQGPTASDDVTSGQARWVMTLTLTVRAD